MFADMPLDNRTVDQLAAGFAAWYGLNGPVRNVAAAQNDLKFRCG
jgi:hypothetical protein